MTEIDLLKEARNLIRLIDHRATRGPLLFSDKVARELARDYVARAEAALDQRLTGLGFMVDGKHVDPSRVQVIVPTTRWPGESWVERRFSAAHAEACASLSTTAPRNPVNQADEE